MDQPLSPARDGDPASSEARVYSPEEARRLREEFAPIADENRRRNRVTAGWFLATIAAFVLAIALPKAAAPYLFFVIIGLLVKTAHAIMSGTRPRCPGCAGEMTPVLDEEFGPYCPDCGKRSLKKGGWFSPCLCVACGRTVGRGRRNNVYRTRACTHCGLWLDDAGL